MVTEAQALAVLAETKIQITANDTDRGFVYDIA